MGAESLLRNAALGVVVAVIGVVVTFFIADAVSGPLLATPPGGDGAEEIPVGAAIFATVVGGAVGAGIAFLSRRTARPEAIFVGICVVALVLYGLFAISAAEETATGIWLNVMHLVAALPIVGSLLRWLQQPQPIS